MVQVSSSDRTAIGRAKNAVCVCSFCKEEYKAYKADPEARYHACPKEECQREYDRIQRQEHRDGVGDSWQERLDRFQPGEEIASFIAKVSGGRFTSNGGAQVTFTGPSNQKYLIVDVTDYTNMMVRVTVTRLNRQEELDRAQA